MPRADGGGISPELTQAAYRVGGFRLQHHHPMMVFFPGGGLLPAVCESTGIGTWCSHDAALLPGFLVSWTGFLLIRSTGRWGSHLGYRPPCLILSLEGDGGLGPPLWVEVTFIPGTMNPDHRSHSFHRSIRQFTPEPVSAEQLD